MLNRQCSLNLTCIIVQIKFQTALRFWKEAKGRDNITCLDRTVSGKNCSFRILSALPTAFFKRESQADTKLQHIYPSLRLLC